MIIGLTALGVVLVAVITFVVVITRAETASASEVTLTPALEPGPDPFTPSVAKNDSPPGTDPPATTQPTVAPASPGATRTYTGGQPGLYGGTRDIGSCDPGKMLDYLDQNPDKKSAWASVQGIQVSELRSYVGKLTSVVLRTDTWVTNHGFANGKATTISSVLQAGTAVMVDVYGVPRVKCYCGNPLTPPTVYTNPTYTGYRWAGFSTTTVVVIQQNTTIINDFTLIDTYTGQPFSRPAGSDGKRDTNAPGGPGTSTSTTQEPGTTTSAPSPPPVSVAPAPSPQPGPSSTAHSPPESSTTTTTRPPASSTSTASTSTTNAPDRSNQAYNLGKGAVSGCGIQLFNDSVSPTGNPNVWTYSGLYQDPETFKVVNLAFTVNLTNNSVAPANQATSEVTGGCP